MEILFVKLLKTNVSNLWRVGGDIVEDVDEHQEEGDEERHAPCNITFMTLH